MNNKVIHLIPILAFAVLMGFFAFNSNMGVDTVHAEASNAQASLELDPVIDISAPSTVTLNCTPGSTDATSQLCTSNATISVTTNNIAGYTLQMNTTSGSSNSLTNSVASPAATIPTLSQAYSSANFPVNYWGYTGGTDKSSETGGYNCSTNYCPILAYESTATNYAPNHTIKQTDAPANNSTTTLTFAGKVNTTKPSGTYTTSITFTAVTNEPPTQPITNGMDMQDIDSEVCGATSTDITYTVVDSRDSKEYTVARLQDGNCWMTQNLALGSSTAMNLTQANSNVGPSGFTLPASVTEGDWTNSLNDPAVFDYAGNHPSEQATTKYGNYYNWAAATAGSGTNTAGEDAPYDICPKNWRLPSAGTDDITNDEFYTMLSYYITTGTWDDLYTQHWSGVTISQLTNAPISIVFSGYYWGDFRDQDASHLWSSTVYSDIGARFLSIKDNGDVYPRNTFYRRSIGTSMRCLIPGV